MKIYWLLRANDAPLPAKQTEPWVDFPVEAVAAESPNFHISDGLFRGERVVRLGLLEHWSAPGRDLKVRKPAGRADALQTIADLSAQGEGFGGSADGHFDKLVLAWRLPDEEYPKESAFAQNPWYDDPGVGAQHSIRSGDKITNPVGAAFGRMGDKAHEIVVLTIALSLLLPLEAPAETATCRLLPTQERTVATVAIGGHTAAQPFATARLRAV